LAIDRHHHFGRPGPFGAVDMKTPLLIINTVVAIASGLLVLIGYFIPGLDFISDVLLQWAVILAAFALLIGMVNLVTVHASRLRERKLGSIYSLVLLLSFGAGLLIFGINAPTGAASMWVFQYIQLPVEASLMAVLVVTLAYSSMRLLRRRAGLLPVIFVVTAFLVLLGMAPIYGYGDIPVLSGLRNWIAQVPAMAGARGVLIGVALGTVATGLRILIGADRPYGGG
jgi:hypothetical protein